MRRGIYFFIAFLSAAITFGCLTAFVNPRYSGMRYGYGPHWGWHHSYYNRWNPYWNYPPPPYPYMYPDSAYRPYRQPENYQQHQ
jgi:hypothetical protein